MLSLEDNRITFELFPYIQCGIKSRVSLLGQNRIALFENRIKEINHIISEPELLEASLIKYYDSTESLYNSVTDVFPNSFMFQKLRSRGLLPRLFGTRNWNLLRDELLCDSHAERFLRYVMKRTSNQQ